MTVKIAKVAVDLDQATIQKQINRKSRGIVGRVLEATAKRRVQKIVKKHYQNAIRQVQRNLITGIPGVRQSRSRAIGFNLPDGTADRYVTGHWAALTERYASSAPKSSVFWRKQFGPRGSGNTNRTLLGDFKVEISKGVSVSSGPTRVEEGGKKSYTIDWDITVTRLKPPLNMYITESLLSGQPVSRLLSGVNKRSIERIVYVEGRRPFIAGMSAQMGRRMRIELQQSVT